MKFQRKLPEFVEAVKWEGNRTEVEDFLGYLVTIEGEELVLDHVSPSLLVRKGFWIVRQNEDGRLGYLTLSNPEFEFRFTQHLWL